MPVTSQDRRIRGIGPTMAVSGHSPLAGLRTVCSFQALMFVLVVMALVSANVVRAQGVAVSTLENNLQAAGVTAQGTVHTATVIVNGQGLFDVIGVSTYPAKKRAGKIAARIEKLAQDPRFDPNSLKIEEMDGYHHIVSGKSFDPVVNIFDEDAALEGVARKLVAATFKDKIEQVIVSYRNDRRPEVKRANAVKAGMLLLALVVGIIVVNLGFRLIDRVLNRHVKGRIMNLEAKSLRIIQGEQIWRVVHGSLRIIRIAIVLVLSYLLLNAALKLFPATRYVARNLLGYVTDPLTAMGRAIVDYIPSLIFLVLLFIVTRYLLKLLYQFFAVIHRKRLAFSGFDPEWALPTYRIVRVVVILFARVVAYPYIPGSQTEAFKGLSIMVGVLFSLGSSSVISNIIAGYTMTYRRAFRVGDRVSIGGSTGDVTEMRVLVTHLRSLKNEEIVIPNSSIINNEVINYSKMAEEQGLILHTRVGIGYEVPWRQVEAMLKMAADRTPGLLRDPGPFVLQTGLSDFAVTYELNAYCRDEKRSMLLYTRLHQNIQDVFNEYEVQIMTPHYERDTPDAKLVPKDHWFAAPAKDPKAETES